MKLACGDHAFPLLDHDLVLDLIAGLGFQGFDLLLAGNRSHVRPEHIRDDLKGAAEAIRAKLDARGLELSDVFCIPWTEFDVYAPNHPEAKEREVSRRLFLDILEFTQFAGGPGITMVPGIDFENLGHQASLELAASELQWRAERCKEAGLRFSVECHMGSVASTPNDTLRLLELAPDLRLTLDYTHYIAPGFSQTEVDPLVPYAAHVQIRGGAPGRVQVGMRDNTIDYEAVLDRLSDAGYDSYLSVEYVWIDWERCNETDNVSETILMRDRLNAKISALAKESPA